MSEIVVKDLQKEIRRVAINYLSRREYYSNELVKKLNERFNSSEDVSAVVANLNREGLQNDSRFIDSFFKTRIEKGFGPIRISRELRERGVDQEVINESLKASDFNWEHHAANVLEKKFGKSLPVTFKDSARRARFIEYRGFSLEHCQKHLGI